jgi:hypothetical protein
MNELKKDAKAVSIEHIKEYTSNGLTTLQSFINNSLISKTRAEILEVVEELSGKEIKDKSNVDTFLNLGTELIWEMVTKNPASRNLLYKYIQRIPSLHSYGSHHHLTDFAAKLGLEVPSVRELKVQLYLPWEKCFFQPCHQDINSLDSSNSITYWIPLQNVSKDYAVKYWTGSHKEGPVLHEEYIEEEFGVYHVKVPDQLFEKYPINYATASTGDIIALNRVLFHSSPEFEKSMTIRSTVVVRYDELANNGLFDSSGKYEHLTPFNPRRYNEEIIPKVRSFLSKPPVIDWKAKVGRSL